MNTMFYFIYIKIFLYNFESRISTLPITTFDMVQIPHIRNFFYSFILNFSHIICSVINKLLLRWLEVSERT
jgi:hypothetical protein